MKKFDKKGFTIVELVIVIAVIAILAGVLIPTFSGIVTKANESKALQEARNLYNEYLIKVDGQPAAKVYVKGGEKFYVYTDGKAADTPVASPDYTAGYAIVTKGAGNAVEYKVVCADKGHKYTSDAGDAPTHCEKCGKAKT